MSNDTETIKRCIRDRNAEAPWGTGPTNPVVREVEISPHCPRCGELRGEARTLRQYDDGVTYYVDVWDNPCGHVDAYRDVAEEARTLAATNSPEGTAG